METRTQVLEVGGASWMSNPRWINNGLVLVGNQSVVDAKLGVVVLQLAGLEAFPHSSGGLILDRETAWIVKEDRNMQKNKKDYTLQCGLLPVAEAQQAAARIKPQEAYLLTPGTKVSIDFGQASIDNAIRDRAIANLAAQFKAIGVEVADGQNLRLVASKTQGETKTQTYRNMHGGGGEVSVSYTIQKYAVQLTLDGNVLWQAGTQTGFAPGMLTMRPGETAQDQVNKMNQNADGFFEKVRIPKLVARPQGLVSGGGTPVFK